MLKILKRPKIGIDLGTANTLVFIPRKGIIINEPSVVAISITDNSIIAIGKEAREMLGKAPDNLIPYMPLKDGVISDYKTTEAMLRFYIKKSLGKFNLLKPDTVVSVPAGVTGAERRAVIEACIKSGAHNAFIIKEPILAALGAGLPIHEPAGNIVVDIGGGTIDVATISLGGIVSHTSVKCAGNKLDSDIVEYVKKNHNLSIGKSTAEKIKISIGSAIQVDNEEYIIIKGRDNTTGLPRQVKISTNEVVVAIESSLKKMLSAIKTVLRNTPPELSSDIIDNGITLTGGTSMLKGLDKYIERRIGVKTRLAEEPLLCVARGTGIALEHLDFYKKIIQSKVH